MLKLNRNSTRLTRRVKRGPEQHGLFKAIDNQTKWAVARAYRAERQKGGSDHPAMLAAYEVIRELVPELAPDEVQTVVAAIIVTAARDHCEWFNEGVSSENFRPTI